MPALLSRHIAVLSMLLVSAAVNAETLRIPETAISGAAAPQRGLSKQQVEQRFGAPTARRAPVGGGHPRRPPITRWDYPAFSVVFERDRVINTVHRNGQTTPTRNQGALQISSEHLPSTD